MALALASSARACAASALAVFLAASFSARF